MNEGTPSQKPAPSPMEQGSLEGNVRMPLTYLGITLLGLDAILASPDPKAALSELLDPIPVDERLEARTSKANAQHAHHGIGHVLRPDEVRRIEISGQLSTLRLLSSILKTGGEYEFSGGSRIVAADGTWVGGSEREALQKLLEQITPERAAFIRTLVVPATETIRDPAIMALLKERKALVKDWQHLSLEARSTQNEKVKFIAREVRDHVRNAVEASLDGRALSPDERAIADAFVHAFGTIL